jgi:hypothetical protein
MGKFLAPNHPGYDTSLSIASNEPVTRSCRHGDESTVRHRNEAMDSVGRRKVGNDADLLLCPVHLNDAHAVRRFAQVSR